MVRVYIFAFICKCQINGQFRNTGLWVMLTATTVVVFVTSYSPPEYWVLIGTKWLSGEMQNSYKNGIALVKRCPIEGLGYESWIQQSAISNKISARV